MIKGFDRDPHALGNRLDVRFQRVLDVGMAQVAWRLWCKIKLTGGSVKLRLASDCELSSSCECRVP